mmetsp:Transcript_70831/g.111963  ORF Transcript_70831/g.111963 Transcript_70831/m.111963 type:complete len:220 (-) Transcript_70831:170-829(-)
MDTRGIFHDQASANIWMHKKTTQASIDFISISCSINIGTFSVRYSDHAIEVGSRSSAETSFDLSDESSHSSRCTDDGKVIPSANSTAFRTIESLKAQWLSICICNNWQNITGVVKLSVWVWKWIEIILKVPFHRELCINTSFPQSSQYRVVTTIFAYRQLSRGNSKPESPRRKTLTFGNRLYDKAMALKNSIWEFEVLSARQFHDEVSWQSLDSNGTII